jgi:N-acyl-D-glutamate deacylase
MKRLRVFLGFLALSLMLIVPAVAADYDLVIKNGRVMDPETKYDSVANVGIKDGQIAVITKDKITGRETIDANRWALA